MIVGDNGIESVTARLICRLLQMPAIVRPVCRIRQAAKESDCMRPMNSKGDVSALPPHRGEYLFNALFQFQFFSPRGDGLHVDQKPTFA